MKPEIEVKFLDVNHDELRAKLKELGAECVQPMRLMRRKNYDFNDGRLREVHGWVRLRDEGDKITLAYKQQNDRTLDGTHEVSVAVEDFDATNDFLQTIGLSAKNHQETRRESWHLDDFAIELDDWPWVKPSMEFEGTDEASMRELADKLGLDWSHAKHGDIAVAFRAEYDLKDDNEFYSIPKITFEEPMPDWLEKRRTK